MALIFMTGRNGSNKLIKYKGCTYILQNANSDTSLPSLYIVFFINISVQAFTTIFHIPAHIKQSLAFF